MDLPVDPVRMSVAELLSELREGYREASFFGPAAAIKFLQPVLRDTVDLPAAVQAVAYELLAESQAELQDWEGCAASMAAAQRVVARAPAAPSTASPIQAAPQEVRVPDPHPAAAAAPAVAPRKVCRDCGRDVAHRPRQKNQATGEYLCLACLSRHEPQPMPGQGRGGLGLLLLALAAVLVTVMVTFLFFDRS